MNVKSDNDKRLNDSGKHNDENDKRLNDNGK